jgi:hypothetical protein
VSHKVVTLVCSRVVGSAVEKAVLVNMADKASDGGEGVYSSKSTIAAETEFSLSSVKRAATELLRRGLIVEAGKRPCANGETVVYEISISAVTELPEWKAARDTRSTVNRVQGEPRPQWTPTRSTVNPHPVQGEPQTILEPSLNHITPTPSGQGDMFAKTAKRNDQPERVVSQPDPDFDEFWSAFPPGRKTDKRQALETFRRIVAGKHKSIPKTDPKVIIAGARRFAASNPDPQFTPIPTTWLNRERWVIDDPPPTAVKRAADFRPGEVYR